MTAAGCDDAAYVARWEFVIGEFEALLAAFEAAGAQPAQPADHARWERLLDEQEALYAELEHVPPEIYPITDEQLGRCAAALLALRPWLGAARPDGEPPSHS